MDNMMSVDKDCDSISVVEMNIANILIGVLQIAVEFALASALA